LLRIAPQIIRFGYFSPVIQESFLALSTVLELNKIQALAFVLASKKDSYK